MTEAKKDSGTRACDVAFIFAQGENVYDLRSNEIKGGVEFSKGSELSLRIKASSEIPERKVATLSIDVNVVIELLTSFCSAHDFERATYDETYLRVASQAKDQHETFRMTSASRATTLNSIDKFKDEMRVLAETSVKLQGLQNELSALMERYKNSSFSKRNLKNVDL